jgi:hypothetical protein
VRIVSWNMHHKNESPENRARPWGGLKADVALLQEAAPPKQYHQVYRAIDARKYNWGSAVVSFRPGLKLSGRPRGAVGGLLPHTSDRSRPP